MMPAVLLLCYCYTRLGSKLLSFSGSFSPALGALAPQHPRSALPGEHKVSLATDAQESAKKTACDLVSFSPPPKLVRL